MTNGEYFLDQIGGGSILYESRGFVTVIADGREFLFETAWFYSPCNFKSYLNQ